MDRYKEFEQLLSYYPFAKRYFDFNERVCDLEGIRSGAGLSSGERIVCQFLAGVWSGENVCDFDFIQAVGTLSDTWLEPILVWARKPCWP